MTWTSRKATLGRGDRAMSTWMDEEDHRHQENRPERAKEVGNGSSCILIKTDQEETDYIAKETTKELGQRRHNGIYLQHGGSFCKRHSRSLYNHHYPNTWCRSTAVRSPRSPHISQSHFPWRDAFCTMF
jgi:hypothetical protein